jgi:hypothetical protein
VTSTTLFFAVFAMMFFTGGWDDFDMDSDLALDGDVATDIDADLGGDIEISDDMDASALKSLDADQGNLTPEAAFKLFSIQSMMAFAMGFGWVGLGLRAEDGLPMIIAYPIAFVGGALLMFFVAYILSKVHPLNHTPKLNLLSGVGT